MTSIPNNLSSSQRAARQTHLTQKKQQWFKYKTGGGLPWLDPVTIPVIQAKMEEYKNTEGVEDYWVSENWQTCFDERYDEAAGNIASPPFSVPYPATYESYLKLKQPYTAQHNILSLPNLDDDASFAGQRLSGANPLMIKKVRNLASLPANLSIKDGDGPDQIKLEQTIRAHRLYICDYSDLGFVAGMGESLIPLINGGPFLVDAICQKYLTAPIGLFYWEGDFGPGEGRLLPYALQLEQQAGAGVFTPKDSGVHTTPTNWRVAKAAFQVADALSHQWDSHLVRTHALLAPFSISGERHLHPDHPVLRLMRPHLRYTLKVNSETGKLTDEGSYGDLLLAPKNSDLMDLIGHFYKRYMDRGFDTMASLENELAARSMTKGESPIHFPYREDGLKVFETIRKFVEEYIEYYYKNDSEVQGDAELGAFVRELTDPNFGGVKGLTSSGNTITSLKDLIGVLTNMIWTAGPAHAAVNYAQWDYMADPRNMPLSGYLKEPEGNNGPPLANHVDFFPQYSLGKLQAGLMYALGTWRMDRLGYYRPKEFTDAHIIKKVIPEFQCNLAKIGGAIFEEDQRRDVSYPYLYPELIPNSTSI